MFKLIDRLLDSITMYRLVLYYLIALLLAAVVLSMAGILHYSPFAIVFSAAVLVLVCWVSNLIFAYVFEAPAGVESSIITGLILALIITPISVSAGLIFLAAAGGLATASKYLLAIHKKHIFNPAAIAVVITALVAGQAASWWVGTTAMLPFVLVGGLLLMRKLRRTAMIVAFVSMALIVTTVFSLSNHGGLMVDLKQIVLNSALFFLAFVMLTEPATSPATTKTQVWYGLLAGALFSPQVHLGSIYSTPELVLVVSNIFAYAVSPRFKLFPKLAQRLKIAPDTYDFIFKPNRKLTFEPGQYMEWTLPHPSSDARGNRRYFTLASSPTEETVRLGVKFYDKGSSFKRALLDIDPQTQLAAAQLSGDFVLPKDSSRKLAFIAGGIGITPYRSMVKYLVDKHEQRDVVLLYSAKSTEEIVYRDVFDEAKASVGLRPVYWLTGERGFIDARALRSEIPDYTERLFYISGTHEMVKAMQAALRELGVHQRNIKVDFFPGYA